MSIQKSPLPNERVFIKPITGSRRFAPASATMVREHSDPSGRTQVVHSELYKGQKIPNSEQGMRIKWDERLKTYLLDMTDEQLQYCVKQLSYVHTSGPKQGTEITECNLKNRLDPFILAVRKHRPYMKEGEINFNLNNPLDFIYVAAAKKIHDFQTPESKNNVNGIVVGTKYQMITENQEIQFQAEESNKMEKAFSLLGNVRKLGDEYAKRIATICDAKVSVLNDSRTLYPYLVSYLNDAKTPSKFEPGLSQQDFFIKVCNMEEEMQTMLYVLQGGRRKGYVKLQSTSNGSYYTYNNRPIGANLQEVVEFFREGENIASYQELLHLVKKV